MRRKSSFHRIAFYVLTFYVCCDAVYHHAVAYFAEDGRGRTVVGSECYNTAPLEEKSTFRIIEKRAQTHLTWIHRHAYRRDGILEVNPQASHPIPELMQRAEKMWNETLERQSRSLQEAIKEYKKRYKRSPPKGFDKWWQYVVDHSVQLPDEYDQIYRNFEPFWGVNPAELIQLQTEFENRTGVYTIVKDENGLSAVNPEKVPRAKDQINMMKAVEEWLPHFRATMSIHDGPGHVVSYEHRTALLQAAAANTYLNTREAPRSLGHGWAANCQHGAPLRHHAINEEDDYFHEKSFIYDHAASMNPCYHPSHVVLNGFLAAHKEGPGPHPHLRPTFAICSTTLHADILTVAPEQWMDDIDREIEWEQKVDERLLWRGSNTGILFQKDMPWNQSQRVRLVEQMTRRGGFAEVLMPHDEYNRDNAPVGTGAQIDVSRMNAALMDIAFTGEPIQCGDKETCERMKKMFEWRRKQGWEEAKMYKYVLDVDGNGWSARFKRLMTSNSLVFKVTIHPEWYTDRIMPWLHFVPIQNDLSDLYDAFVFFHGDLNGENGHDELAKKLAIGGRNWSKTFWRKEDMTAYMFRLMLEYARVMSLDREAMTMKV